MGYMIIIVLLSYHIYGRPWPGALHAAWLHLGVADGPGAAHGDGGLRCGGAWRCGRRRGLHLGENNQLDERNILINIWDFMDFMDFILDCMLISGRLTINTI